MSERDKARCPRCHQVAYVNKDGRLASHKAWNGYKVAKCPGVGAIPWD